MKAGDTSESHSAWESGGLPRLLVDHGSLTREHIG